MSSSARGLGAAARDLRTRVVELPPWVIDAALAVLVAATVLVSGATAINDWKYYALGAEQITGPDALALYADRPWIQIGPLALLLSAMLEALPGSGITASVIVISLLLVPVLALVRLALEGAGRDPAQALDRGWARAIIALGWFSVAAISQVGDVLGLLGLLGAAVLLMRAHPWWAGSVFALGVAAKPWILAGLVVLMFAPRALRWRAIGAAIVVGAACWLPFVLGDGRTLEAGRIQYYVPPDAWQRWLGVGDLAPDGWRIGQLLLIWIAMIPWFVQAARRGDWNRFIPVVLGATTLIRLITELGTWPYYVSVALPLILLAERSSAPGRRPIATLLTLFAAIELEPLIGSDAAAAVRLAALVGALVVVVMRHQNDARPAKDESGPPPLLEKNRSST